MAVNFLPKLLASVMRNYFPKRTSGAPLHILSKLYDVPVCFVSPSYEAMYCYICSRRRVVVARYQMICLVLRSVWKCQAQIRRYSHVLPCADCQKVIVLFYF